MPLAGAVNIHPAGKPCGSVGVGLELRSTVLNVSPVTPSVASSRIAMAWAGPDCTESAAITMCCPWRSGNE